MPEMSIKIKNFPGTFASEIECCKLENEAQKSSGIIIATGAGSTAWYGSVVKESFNPEMKELRFVVREPYKGKLGANQKLYIKSKMTSGIVAVDSIIETPFSNEEEIEVSISPNRK